LLRPHPDPAHSTTAAAHPLAPIQLSDRLLVRVLRLVRRIVAANRALAGSLALHGLALAALLHLPALGEAPPPPPTASEIVEAQADEARTKLRRLQHQVTRIAEIRRQLGADAGASPASEAALAAGDPNDVEALAARAQALDDAIEAWSRENRASALAKLAHMPLADARRAIAEEARTERPPPKGEPAPARIERLAQRARATLEGRRLQLEAAREGVRVARADPPKPGAVDPVDQDEPAGGLPFRAGAGEQLLSMVRLGPAQGRVGTVGVDGGRSVNPEGVVGMDGGHVQKVHEPDRNSRTATHAATRGSEHGTQAAPPGGRPDASGAGPGAGGPAAQAAADGAVVVRAADARHTHAPYVPATHRETAAVHVAAGRLFGPGGSFANRVYLDSWYVIGPFPGNGAYSLDRVYPPEEDIDLDGAYPGSNGAALRWHFRSRGFYPFVPPDIAADAVYYAYTEIRVDHDSDVTLSIGADDDSKMWVDEELVWVSKPMDKPWYRPPYYMRDELVASMGLVEGQRRVHLARGVHRILFKLYNAEDRTFFSVVVSP
jgi:hypothetical protein